MKLYLSGVYANHIKKGQPGYENLSDYEKQVADYLPNIVETYASMKRNEYSPIIRSNGGSVFLTYGNVGANVDVAGYCRFIKANTDIIAKDGGNFLVSVVNVPGNPLQTWRNQTEMEARGVIPVPYFSYGEDEQYLQHYLANYPDLMLGGIASRSVDLVIPWLDRIWGKYLIDSYGKPKIKVHSDNILSPNIISRYPWYSIRTELWSLLATSGSIIIPDGEIYKIDNSETLRKSRNHIFNRSKLEQEYVEQVVGEFGINYERVTTSIHSRALFNAYSLITITNSNDKVTFNPETMELF